MRGDVGVHLANRLCFDTGGLMQVEGPDRSVKIVTTKIAERTAAEGPKIAPRYRRVSRMKRSRLARSKPQVPVDAGRYRRRLFRAAAQCWIPAARFNPRVDFAYRANCAIPNPLTRLANALTRMKLI